AVLEFHPTWGYLEPFALAMVAAWGAWCRRNGLAVTAENLGRHAVYAARMRLFEHLGVDFPSGIPEDEGERFLPVTQVRTSKDLRAVLRDLPRLLSLRHDPEGVASVRYCVSELVRNALEHSGCPDGVFVCVKRYADGPPRRVTIAVADCGQGLARHLAPTHPLARGGDADAIALALDPGVTGGDQHAGLGLPIVRTMAKGTGGYFLLVSGRAAYRLRRTLEDEDQLPLLPDSPDEDRTDRWEIPFPWQGTVVSVELRTERIGDYGGFLPWVFRQLPAAAGLKERIRFT
ncbi:MAG TPA: ATP-binding protein, partial [Longimicrobiaceae bacterium]|nr:ATP-binding protein [Longimicrobiaceae bacterium]